MALLRVSWCAALALCASGAALAAVSTVDPLDPVKTAIRLKNFSAAATALQQLAAGGNVEAQYLLGVFCLNGVSGPRDPQAARAFGLKRQPVGGTRAPPLSVVAPSRSARPAGAQRWLKRAHELGFATPKTQAPPPGVAAGLPSSPCRPRSSTIRRSSARRSGWRRRAGTWSRWRASRIRRSLPPRTNSDAGRSIGRPRPALPPRSRCCCSGARRPTRRIGRESHR